MALFHLFALPRLGFDRGHIADRLEEAAERIELWVAEEPETAQLYGRYGRSLLEMARTKPPVA